MSDKKKPRVPKRGRSTSLSPTHNPNPTATIEHLESLLKKRDERIRELEAKVQSQETLLEHRLQCVERLQRERDELRNRNATLIGKTAELSRKQSAGSFVGPSNQAGLLSQRSIGRAATLRPGLPPPPAESPEPQRRSLTPTVLSRPQNGSPERTNAELPLIPANEDSETDYSDMEDEAPSKSGSNSPLRSPSSNSLPVIEENPLHATAIKSAMHACDKTKPIPIASRPAQHTSVESPTTMSLPKSSGSGAIAQHLKQLLNSKKNSEKSITVPPSESPVGNGTVKSPLDSVAESVTSLTSNASTLSEQTTTDAESSIDTNTSTSPTSSVPPTKSRIRWVQMDDQKVDEVDEMLEENREYSMRGRTHTLAAINSKGKKPMERGRRRLKELKKEEKKRQSQSTLKRQSSLTDLHRGNFEDHYEFFSPVIATWIREKIVRDLEKKYGGSVQANKAAAKIQTTYREYKLQSRFKEMRREKHIRNRAQSMRTPGRRPSILNRNRPHKYRRDISTPDTRSPAVKAREAANLLSKERLGHSHSGARLNLVEQKRQKVVEFAQVSLEENLEGAPVDPAEIVVNIEGACEEESSTDPKPADKTDGLTTAYSTNDIPGSRPLSIFSTGSAASTPSPETQLEGVVKLRNLPRSAHAQYRSRRFSLDTTKQKKNIGVNHFNKKPTRGIQYLVMSDILEDDPRCVAEFLMGQYGLSKEKIGEFLGEINSDFNMAVLECLVEHMEMCNKPIDEALRQFQQIFRMPGEAQKIDKIMEVFAIEYYKANKESALIRSEDAAYMLSFAIMMLHTSLHNPSVRSRITKKQWVSMNRGCNEGENFPETMLMEIYDRLLTHEFTTGTDHTDEVIKVEKQITGLNMKLAQPQRRLLGKYSIHEVHDPNSKSYRTHRRTLFVFSDTVIVCKNRSRSEYTFKDSFSLINTMPIAFESQYYKYGVQVHSSMEHKIVLQCNFDSSHDRDELLMTLDSAISELSVMETERIAELGTSLAAKPNQESRLHGGSVKHNHRISRGPAELMDPFEESNEQSDFVPGVGDIATGSYSTCNTLLRDSHVPGAKKENRSSGDSGFDSQQPTPSPSPTEPARYTPTDSPSPSHTTYLTPNPSLTSSPTHSTPSHTTYATLNSPAHTTTLTPSHLTPNSSRTSSPAHVTQGTTPTSSPSHLAPGVSLTPPPRSKSSDAIRTLTIIPSPAHDRSPSAELYRDTKEKTSSPKKVKKGRDSAKKKTSSLFSFGRSKPSSPSHRRGSSPAAARRGSFTPPTVNKQGSLELSAESRGRSSSSVDLTQTT